MLRILDDLAGSIWDLLLSIRYFFVGFIAVAVPIYLFAKFFEWIL